MTPLEATNNTQLAPEPITRSRLSFRQLGAAVPARDNGEPLVLFQLSPRLQLAPFWEEANDLEGQCYQEFLASHPTFRLMARQGVVQRLHNAASLLPDNWDIVVRAGYRPLAVQRQLLQSLAQHMQHKDPLLSAEQALDQARLFVADPARKLPPHCVGAAVDIEVIDAASGKLVDMGCPANTDAPIAHTHSPLASKQQQKNRHILLEAMLAAGFANLAYEWWHYSYGDGYWAAFYNQPHALYGLVQG